MADASIARVIQYQDLLKREKKALLSVGEAREVLAVYIDSILEAGMFRSIKRETLTDALEALRKPRFNARAEIVDELIALPFYEVIWNKARKAAKLGPGADSDKATVAWEKVFHQAAQLRNVFLDEYAFLIPKMIRYYFQGLSTTVAGDLESEGILGLFRALESFNPKKNGDLRIHIQTRIISTLMDFYKNTEYAKAKLAQKETEGKEPTAAEGGERVSRTLVENLSESSNEFREGETGGFLVSIDDFVTPGDDNHYADVIVGPENNPFEVSDGQALLERMHTLLAEKPEIERFLIQSKWNLHDEGLARSEPREVPEAVEKLRAESARRLRAALVPKELPAKEVKKAAKK